MEESDAPEHVAGADRVISRRTVIRTAAHAAWAVPVISAVSAAPVFAANSNELLFQSASGVWTLPTGGEFEPFVTASLVVENLGGSDALDLKVTVTFPNFYVYGPKYTAGPTGQLGNRVLTISGVSAGWTAKRTYSGSTTGRTATVVFTATTQVAAGEDKTLEFKASTRRFVASNDTISDIDNVTPIAATATGFLGAATEFNPGGI